MPYIKPERRNEIDPHLVALLTKLTSCDATVGDLNYVVSKIIHGYVRKNGLRYEHLNAVIGMLECAKLEVYRSLAAPYEDKKARENGSVSELDEQFFK